MTVNEPVPVADRLASLRTLRSAFDLPMPVRPLRSELEALDYAIKRLRADAPVPDQAGAPNEGVADDFPLLYEKARAFDFAERLGGCSDPLLAEIDAALRELWDARRNARGA